MSSVSHLRHALGGFTDHAFDLIVARSGHIVLGLGDVRPLHGAEAIAGRLVLDFLSRVDIGAGAWDVNVLHFCVEFGLQFGAHAVRGILFDRCLFDGVVRAGTGDGDDFFEWADLASHDPRRCVFLRGALISAWAWDF